MEYLLTTVLCRHFISPRFYCNTYKRILHHKKYNNRLCYAEKIINERCHGDDMQVVQVNSAGAHASGVVELYFLLQIYR